MVYTLEEIKEKVYPVIEKYGLKSIYLFGSYARGEADETSDVDLAIELVDEADYFEIYCKLADLFNDKVDVLSVSTLLNPETHVGQLVKRNFMKERVLL